MRSKSISRHKKSGAYGRFLIIGTGANVKKRYGIYFGVSAICTALAMLSGCSFDAAGCVSDDDCRSGRVCDVSGLCVDPDELENNANNINNTNNTQNNVTTGDNGMTPVNATSPNGTSPDPDMSPPVPDMETMPDPDMGPPPRPDMEMPPVPDMEPPVPDMPPAPDMGPPEPDMPPPVPDMNPMPDMDPPAPDMAPVLGPIVRVTPASTIDFGILVIGQTSTASLLVENLGDAPLELSSLDLTSRPSQGFDVAPVVTPMAPDIIAPGDSRTFTATFQPTVQGQYGNSITVVSDDPNEPTIVVDLEGQAFPPAQGRCLTASPDPLDFGLVPTGGMRTLQLNLGNCSSQQPVTVTSLGLDDGMSGFSYTSSLQPPFTLQVGQSATVDVTFTSPGNADAEDALVITSDSQFGSQTEVDLVADGGSCPEAVILGESVSDLLGQDGPHSGVVGSYVMDSISLDAGASSSSSGQLTYLWSLVGKPSNSAATLNSTSATANFGIDAPGSYLVELEVVDPVLGISSCAPAQLEVVAFDAQPRLKTTVTWDSEHDVDLHVLRSDAMGNYPMFGDLTDDLFYDNMHAAWGQSGTFDDGVHLGDDTDGFGPEIAVVGELEAGRKYLVIAQFSRVRVQNDFRFDVTVDVELQSASPTGPVAGASLTHEFFVNQQGRRYIAFEIDGTSATITPIDTTN
jgi:hypothetical protein